MYAKPIVLLSPVETAIGTAYLPANEKAKALFTLMRRETITDAELVFLEKVGFSVDINNNNPIPYPKAYNKKMDTHPRYIKDIIV